LHIPQRRTFSTRTCAKGAGETHRLNIALACSEYNAVHNKTLVQGTLYRAVRINLPLCQKNNALQPLVRALWS